MKTDLSLASKIFSFAHDRQSFRRVFLILLFCFVSLSTVGILSLYRYFEKTRILEVSDRLEKYTSETLSVFRNAMVSEGKRPFAEYSFYNLRKTELKSFLKFSNISSLALNTRVPGVIGYFQIRSAGELELPFFPRGHQIALEQLEQRAARAQEIFRALKKTQVLAGTDEDNKNFRAAFGRVAMPDLNSVAEPSLSESAAPVVLSKFIGKAGVKVVPTPPKAKALATDINFESQALAQTTQMLSLQAFLLESGYLVLYRVIFQNEQKFLQGMLVDQRQFFKGLFRSLFAENSIGPDPRISFLIDDNVLNLFPKSEPAPLVLLRNNLPSPLDRIQVVYSVTKLPFSRTQTATLWSLGLVLLFLILGMYLFYQNSLRQFDLLRQQSNFVSAISHELRTPLTAIRMHGEMLASNWMADENQKRKSYAYIVSESERLSRLIENVLRFSRLGRSQEVMDMQTFKVGQLISLMLQKLEPMVSRAGFELVTSISQTDETIYVDADALSQILINLVDNALKFSQQAPKKQVILFAKVVAGEFHVSIRDFGPGIPQDVASRVFELFVRAENEMTRKTTGTGIGLALAKSLVEKMNGSIDFKNQIPGCEFTLTFPVGTGPL